MKRNDTTEQQTKRANAKGGKLQSDTEIYIAHHERRIAKADSELWRRRAIALSFFTFAFLGFPLSVTFRHRHRLIPFFLAMILVIMVFYPLLLLGETLCISHQVPATLAMLSGNVVLLGIASFLTGRLLLR